ncbi:hypothetical protein [Phaeocystidibacter marisrubri]|uniref:Uncharacterized protein n=1 Tax=Phaeocystidibacter marisrubri TaxID=1577780 RepID=A0A6L3ZI17_9FLAO|nr:hypothetical protein [Phaeocystidibacter marisrubri]KAB2816820.1 hypothetical protein F8C82_00020 [Phaeocystidibacter marisrubri]GGH78013.1 hypothetical protein GCM10011318_28650 [Phaeocystidibacter marisrubri]
MKKVNHFHFHMDNYSVPVNKAEKELLALVEAYNGTLLIGLKAKKEFKTFLEMSLKQINRSHPRCKDLTITHRKYKIGRRQQELSQSRVYSAEFIPIHKIYPSPQLSIDGSVTLGIEATELQEQE